MKIAFALGSAALFAATALTAKPAEVKPWPELGVETAISFPDRNIRNFEADGERGVWIEDRQRRWYYARLNGICPGLTFAQGIGFDSRGSARFDRSSMILVEGDLCAIGSFVTANRPLPRKQREKAAQR